MKATRPLMSLTGILVGLTLTLEAAEVTVISGGAVEPGLRAAAAAFEKETGHSVRLTFNTTPQIREQLSSSAVFDVVIAPPAVITEFSKSGAVGAGGIDLGSVGSGVAVRPGAPVPAIATADDIRRAVLEADSVVFNRASTGLYFENLLKKMGVWDQVEPKTTRYATGGEVMKHALKGTGREVAFGPITEILLEKDHGLVFVGPLPPEIQNYTSYIAAPTKAGGAKEPTQALVAFLVGPVAKALFVAAGIE